LHGLDERQANEVLVALEDGAIAGWKAQDGGADGGWTVEVDAGDASRAHRLLADRDLPRPRPPGFGDVFAKGSMVPTTTEEHALYLHALAGELARSVESIDGVVGARVHLGLPQPDPLRPGERPPPRGAVLIRCRRAACPAIRALEPSIRALVSGAADGLEPAAVSVVIAEARETPPAPPRRTGSPLLRALSALATIAALGVVLAALWIGRRRRNSA
jgi:type III secretion protein J